ncbi:hypothetical protein HK405_011436, partial [Cladochytrium tenue]
TFAEKEIVYREGWFGDTLFMVVKGYAVIKLGGMSVGIISPGSYFGESSILGCTTRLETVVAVTMLTCVELTRNAAMRAIEDIPDAMRKLEELRRERIDAIGDFEESLKKESEMVELSCDAGFESITESWTNETKRTDEFCVSTGSYEDPTVEALS